jgi:hypothetical protein
MLKVPAQFVTAPEPAPAAPPAVPPSPNGARSGRRGARAIAGIVPLVLRAGLWIVAVPLGFVVVFGLARVAGVLSTNQLEDLFLETGWDRFWPVARLLPFVALVSAAVVHFAVLGTTRWRARHATRLRPVGHDVPERPEPVRPAS